MKMKTGLLLATMAVASAMTLSAGAIAGNKKADKAPKANSKIDICHLTSSATNPSVLINVSVNAAAAHYGHGDPVEFTTLPNGKCAAVVDEPDEEEPPVLLPLCAGSSAFGPFTVWDVLYDPASGEFTGIEAGAADVTLTGVVNEAGTVFESGKTLEMEIDGLTASSHTVSLFDGVFANYYINVFNSDNVLLEDEGVFTFIDCNPDTDPL